MLCRNIDNIFLVIPARYMSSRLPGKPLINLCGIPMLIRTYNQCAKVLPPNKIAVATDDKRIAKICIDNKINFYMTSKKCLTGTDRVSEVAKLRKEKIYINVQGDEPIFNPKDLKKIILYSLKNPDKVLTGYTRIEKKVQIYSNSIPKVVFSQNNKLIYASRSAVPGNKSGITKKAWRQVCAYAYPKKELIKFSSLEHKTPLENEEDIEILRFLEIGIEVNVVKMSNQSISIDTQDDIKAFESFMKKVKAKENRRLGYE
jgi:3-deoxy-manno-octulosonate cytidylyltransferase (CMP-KDO synthetase)